jgi:hypothetical protein
VATAAQNRLNIRRNPHTSFAAASDCRTIAIYEYTPEGVAIPAANSWEGRHRGLARWLALELIEHQP